MDFECKKCGWCCKDFMLIFPVKDNADMEYVQELLWVINAREGMSAIQDGRRIIVKYETRCKHLTEDNLCDCYHEQPEICRSFRCDMWDPILSVFSKTRRYGSTQEH
jgi:Fe-S-cluster containining protein